ncbi:DUF423 domain-containing protein [Luteibacter sp. UNCMF366Tsu5.1]|uniref:DUF423 domain-containing protein n=1 Tax=Luteibacter sp. UNCMF366Tsu5.1 TaxID=1502758 RepID=UPI0009084E6A|nr:DUF423 domain-containing protein [Luteibacter sp. UNCMF366Tsu5.1]SFW60911.1 Uncharacterized membrane protein YgdD, TMEM256/DUF423 family [Luteibacter sp. UNCMF366Tsu5.1]
MRHRVSNATAALVGAAGATAVAFGAFGAHALRNTLDASALATWHTGVEYHFWHALALLATCLLPASRARQVAQGGFALGILFFSGSLYALALGAPRWFGPVTPLGGVAFIVGWLALGFALRANRD